MNNAYHFITRWDVEGSAEEVYDLISEPLGFPRWWPSVYIEVREIDSGDAAGQGKRVALRTKGWLPYMLQWESVSMETVRPNLLSIRATGDFDGTGVWNIGQRGEYVHVVFDWKLTAEKPLLRNLSFLLKPLFSANHRWAMARGEKSLRLELTRRHARTSVELNRVPPPPGPNTTSGYWLAAGAAAALIGLFAIARTVLR